MKKIITFLRRNWIYFTPFLLLLLFIISIYDTNYYIGGDFIFPLKPQDNILRTIYLWDQQNGGKGFFNYVLLLWEGVFYIFHRLNIPSFISIKLFITSIYILEFIFSYKLYQVLFRGTKYENKRMALFFAIVFLLNPAAILMIVGTLPLYAFPICFYFLVKYLDTKNILYAVFFSFFVSLSFFPDLPQAKLLVVFSLATVFFLLIYKVLRNVSFASLIMPLLLLGIVGFFLNAIILVPFINDMVGEKGLYQYYTTNVIVYNGNADLFSAALPYITRFFNANIIDKHSGVGQFLTNTYFSIWTFFLLTLAFSSVFFVREKKEKIVLYLMVTAFVIFIFIAKGGNPPFGEVYHWSLFHIPLAKLFRTTATVIIGGVTFYTFLVTISLYYITRNWQIIFYLFLVVHTVLFYPVYFGLKLDTWVGADIRQKGIVIPKEYFSMGNTLNNIKSDGRIVVFPLNDGYIVKSWGYSGQSIITWLTNKPLLSSKGSLDNNLDVLTSIQLCTYASFYNINYLLIEKDTKGTIIKKDIDFPGKKIKENQYFNLLKTNDVCYSQRFYLPRSTILFKGNTRNITNLSYLPIFNKSSAILTSEGFAKAKEEQLAKSVDNIAIEVTPHNVDNNIGKKVYIHSVLGEDHLINEIIYPYVSISPNSPFYFLIIWKEDEVLKNNTPLKRQLLDFQLLFASKRINEINRWGVSDVSWEIAQKRFRLLMSNAVETAAISENPIDNLELVYEYIQGFRKKIVKISNSAPFWTTEKVNSWEVIFKGLEKAVRKRYFIYDYNNLSYNFIQPVKGTYQGYLLLNKGKRIGDDNLNMNISLNNNQIASFSAKEISDKKVLELGTLPVGTAKNNIVVHISNKQNLIDNTKWNSVEQLQTVTVGPSGILFSPFKKVDYNVTYSNPVVYQQINKWEAGETYLLQIKHTDYNNAVLHIRLREKQQIYDKVSDSWVIDERNIVNEDLISKPHGDTFQLLVTADKNTKGASLYINGADGTVKIDDISIEKIVIPHIYLVKEREAITDNIDQNVNVQFTKINPTKYKVTMQKLKKPTYLVFSESFDPRWKVEGTKKGNILEAEHFFANGYANAWYIRPEDINGNNELIIEYAPQKLFTWGAIISVLSLLVCISYALYAFIKKKRYNKSIKK